MLGGVERLVTRNQVDKPKVVFSKPGFPIWCKSINQCIDARYMCAASQPLLIYWTSIAGLGEIFCQREETHKYKTRPKYDLEGHAKVGPEQI